MPAPELVHVATIVARLGSERFPIGVGPTGDRSITEVTAVTVTGDRLNATMAGTAAADWLTIAPDRSYATLDVRFTLRTDDDALIYCEYSGRVDMAAGRAISAPLFQCGDERYDWINRSQFIGDGTVDRATNSITYELYEVCPT